MTVSIISGAIGYKDLSSVATFKRDVGLGIALLDPKSNPLVLLASAGVDMRGVADTGKATLKKSAAIDPKIEWVEDALIPTVTKINYTAGYSAAATSLVVDTDEGDYIVADNYLYVKRTGEIILVASVSGDTITVTAGRGALSTTAAAINDNDDIIILPIGAEEGGAVATARSTLKSLAYNYCEIIKTSISMTNTTKNTAMLGEERDWEYQKTKGGIQHAEKIELAMLFGARSSSSSGTEQQRTMSGLTSIITSNVYNAGGTLTRKNFDQEVCEAAFKRGRGSSDRVLLASPRLNGVICSWGQDYVRYGVADKTLGMVVNEYNSPSGRVYVIPHHLISGTQGVCGIMIDPGKVKYRYLQNRDTTYSPDVVKTGVDAETGQYLSEVSLEYRNESTGALIKNVEQ